jgi:hypothetical protein
MEEPMNTLAIACQQSGALSLVHLRDAACDTLAYIGGPRAFERGAIEVRELSDDGTVNALLVLNTSGEPVFLLDGEVLEGAKQTRVLNGSVLLAPRSKTRLPVSCVESGRWRYTTPSFSSASYISPARLRAGKSRRVSDNLRSGRGYDAGQGEVWRSVDDMHASMGTSSPTASLSDMFDQKKMEFDAFVAPFAPHPEANGLAVFAGKRLLGVDLFNRRDVCAEYFPKLLRGAAAEACALSGNKDNAITEAEARYRAVEFLDRIDALEATAHPGIGLGEERRFTSEDITGFVLHHGKALVHLAALNNALDAAA